jgi:hypothetical protein
MDVIPLPLEASFSGGSRLPVCPAAAVEVFAQQSELQPLATWMASWISKRWGLACHTASAEAGPGGGRSPTACPPQAAPLPGRALLRRVRLRVDAVPAGRQLRLGESVEAEAYVLSLQPDAPGEALVSAATVAGVARGAGGGWGRRAWARQACVGHGTMV